MTIVAVTGDCTTTTCVALSGIWPVDDAIILEADPSGGSLAAWLDTPSSPSLATMVAATSGPTPDSDSTVETILSMLQRSPTGIRFVAAPTRAVPARRAIEEANRTIVPALARPSNLVTIADLGRPSADRNAVVDHSGVVVVMHRQATASAAAESVRLERLVEHVERLTGSGAPIVIGIIGTDPFDPNDIGRFVDDAVPGAVIDVLRFPEDPLTAAVLAGRTGVSAKRLQRLPLMRAAAAAAAWISPFLDSADVVDDRTAAASAEMLP